MQYGWNSAIITFLAGTAVGAAGMYYAEKYTDIRRKKEYKKERKKQFIQIIQDMPELIAEFKNDLSDEKNKLIREFFVLANRKVHLGGSTKPRFVYYDEDHENLRNKVDLLEDAGFVTDVTEHNVSVYRMTEELVMFIEKYG